MHYVGNTQCLQKRSHLMFDNLQF